MNDPIKKYQFDSVIAWKEFCNQVDPKSHLVFGAKRMLFYFKIIELDRFIIDFA